VWLRCVEEEEKEGMGKRHGAGSRVASQVRAAAWQVRGAAGIEAAWCAGDAV
jgi:hypothetical protein